VRCSDLLGAADDDRAAAAMFYYGYLAAKASIHVIDVGKIDENVGKVMKQCAATPNLTVPQAFRQALRPRRSAGRGYLILSITNGPVRPAQLAPAADERSA
jgi:hypothetical protein